MKLFYTCRILTACLLLAIAADLTNAQNKIKDTDGSFWKNQAVNNIIPYWTRHAIDSKNGAFYTNLDRNWNTAADKIKYPSMISRNIFGYSAAYLLTGDEQYIKIAGETVKSLINNGWDKTYGGWYDALDETGKPIWFTKDTFVQIYAITGLAMYYFVTHDSLALDYIEKSNFIMETNYRDNKYGGYYKILNQDLTVKDSTKDFASQVAPLSGYLIYLYLATREQKYLEQMERVMNTVVDKMIDPESGWVQEYFNRDWSPTSGTDKKLISIGHNIETAWMLYRLYRLDNNDRYLKCAEGLAGKIIKYGFNNDTGAWCNTLYNNNNTVADNSSVWWIQAYGNMFYLYLYQVTGEQKYIDYFTKSARFWNDYIVDKELGDTYLSVFPDGKMKEGTKGNRFKASYHNMEHCLLNYLYLDLGYNNREVSLYFRLTGTGKYQICYPLPVENQKAMIKDVTVNGLNWNDYFTDGILIDRFQKGIMNFKVTLGK